MQTSGRIWISILFLRYPSREHLYRPPFGQLLLNIGYYQLLSRYWIPFNCEEGAMGLKCEEECNIINSKKIFYGPL